MLRDLNQAEITGKKVLVRIDTDVDIEDGKVLDDERLRASIPTIRYLLDNGAAQITIIGHIGRPKGKVVEELKMKPVEEKLVELLGSHNLWLILENTRFDPREETNDPQFARELAEGQDIFVQDAFATCHRAHASTAGVAEVLPFYAGLAVQKEVENLSKLLTASDLTIIIGGKKAADKLPVISHLWPKAKTFLIGGVVANTFLAVQKYPLGKSLVEEKVLAETGEILKKAQQDGGKLQLPVDVVISKSFEEGVEERTVSIDELKTIVLDDYYVVDIGPETQKRYQAFIDQATATFWNGNMGVSEVPAFNQGTLAIAQAIAKSSARKYAGGGDTTSFLRAHGLSEKFDFISNGGGATLEFLAGKKLPGLDVLK